MCLCEKWAHGCCQLFNLPLHAMASILHLKVGMFSLYKKEKNEWKIMTRLIILKNKITVTDINWFWWIFSSLSVKMKDDQRVWPNLCPRLLGSSEQWHCAERGEMMSGDEESKSFTSTDTLMGCLTDYEESSCASPCVTGRMSTDCDRACVPVSPKKSAL